MAQSGGLPELSQAEAGRRRRRCPRPIPVWIDTDPAVGLPDRDVDDGLALVQAFHSPELVVRGVSVVFGNAPLEQAMPIAETIVKGFGPRGLGVYRGAAAAADLGVEIASDTRAGRRPHARAPDDPRAWAGHQCRDAC